MPSKANAFQLTCEVDVADGVHTTFACAQVNEIYRDLANIVEQQQEAVEQIGTNTEGAHARAQEGLVQVCVSVSPRVCSLLLMVEVVVVSEVFVGRLPTVSASTFARMLALPYHNGVFLD